MTIDSFDIVFYTCTFLLPGFIIKSIIDSLTPANRHNDTKYFFSCLLYSIINCASCSWLYIAIAAIAKLHPVRYWILMLGITIISAVIVAIIIGFIKQKGIIDCLFSKIGIRKINSVPTAWDYFFSNQEAVWVIITLKSGKTVYGSYSTNSFASSDSDERDLYIEKIYDVDKDMKWQEDPQCKGIYIAKEEIETIEFIAKE